MKLQTGINKHRKLTSLVEEHEVLVPAVGGPLEVEPGEGELELAAGGEDVPRAVRVVAVLVAARLGARQHRLVSA